jgi:hypothetical protein
MATTAWTCNSVDVFYTVGTPPLSVIAGGSSRHFTTRAALLNAINAVADAGNAQTLALLAMARALNTDPAGAAAFKAMVVGDTVTVDFSDASGIAKIEKDHAYSRPGMTTQCRLLIAYPGVPVGTVLTKIGEWYRSDTPPLAVHQSVVQNNPDTFGP